MFIIGYPKSGNTWFCYLLAYCLNAEYDDFDNPGVHPRSDYERQYVKGGLHHRSWQDRTGPVLKTHKKYLKSGKDEVIIYLVRDGRDVIVSYFHYLQKFFPGTFRRSINGTGWRRFFRLIRRQDDFGVFVRRYAPAWAAHVNSWLDKRFHALVRYEDLKENPVATLHAVFTALQVEVPERIIREALDIFSFARMSGRSEGQEDKNSFYRKGVSGDWQNQFSSVDLDYFNKRAGSLMTRLGYEEV
ncbi:MAG: sulfotransferase domain-containing protein [Deltaproteobacteria bacterium]